MQDLYRITYISKNTIPNDKVSIREQVDSILKSATKNNPELGITGALLYSGGHFCQVIEGEEDNLEELFETIQMDDRHGEITVLSYEAVDSRAFSEWAMAYAGISDEDKLNLDGIKGSKDEIRIKETSANILFALEKAVVN